MIDNRPRSIGELLDAAVTLSVRHAPLLGAIAAVPAAEAFLVSLVPSSHPKDRFTRDALVFVTLATGVVSQIATAVAVNDIVHGTSPRLGSALAAGFRTLVPALGVYLRYTPAFVLFGGILFASVGGIITRNPVYVTLGAIGVALMVVPFGLTSLATQVGVVHRALVSRNPEFKSFAGGVVAFSTEGRNVLAAISLLALESTGFLVNWLLVRAFPMPAAASEALQQCVGLVASIVGSTFLTLFYLDLRARNTGADLAQAAAALKQEATTTASD